MGTRVGIPGWVQWVGTGEGYTGYYPCTAQGGPVPAKRAPGSPAGAGAGWVQGRVRVLGTSAAGTAISPPCGPGQPTRGLPWDMPLECRLRANMARFRSIFLKVSQNGQVSPKYRHKASHSPCFQNGLRKSPLEFLRFPSEPAFSHKELMGHFRP